MNENVLEERAILIGLSDPRSDENEVHAEWEEFVELAKTAGAVEVSRFVQTRPSPDPAYFIGSGKARMLAEEVKLQQADLVISLQELSPSQVRNLEELTGVRVIDRTNLILDIFAARAWTREGKLQVELAQLNYMLPRLTGSLEFSRLGGGIGTRGPGETKLEVDRRRVRHRITELRRELLEVEKQRRVMRHLREKKGIAAISLIGYTNAGKSTLFNRLTEAMVPARDRLFDTLDPVSRKITLPRGTDAILLDTVGFIRNLPHQLVSAFKATLEETIQASILLHIMDASSPELEKHYHAVAGVLKELKIETKETIRVLNKSDRIGCENTLNRLAHEWSGCPVSALTGAGLDNLLAEIERKLTPPKGIYKLLLPYGEANLLPRMHTKGRVLQEDYLPEGIRITLEGEHHMMSQFARFFTGDEEKC